MTDERLARRRAQRRERQATQAVHQVTQPLHTLPTYELVSEEGLHKIHDASLTILSARSASTSTTTRCWPSSPSTARR